MSDDASAEPFTLREVLGDALDALRSDWRAHVGWNLIWASVVMVSCCGTMIMVGFAGAMLGISRHGGDPSARLGETSAVLALVYLVLLPLMLALYALHQSVTMTLTHAFCRGTPMSMRAAIEQGLRRTPALVAHLLLRTFVEGVPILLVYALCFGIVWGGMGVHASEMMHGGAGVGIVFVLGYVVVLAFALGVRGFLGLGFASVVDGIGPVAAFGHSVRLLRGRRWQFIRKRLAVLAAWMIAYMTCAGPFFAASFATQGHPNPTLTLLTLPFLLGFYGVMLLLVVADAALEASYHARVTRPLDAAALAATFD